MRHPQFMPVALIGLLFAAGSFMLSRAAQQSSSDTVPVSTIVSVEAKHHKDIPAIARQDVTVLQGKNRPKVTEWIPLQGVQANLELFLLIDDASTMRVASQLDDLRHFMDAQPGTTSVAIGYMQNGTVRIAQNFTNDHPLAGKALRMPLGGEVGETSPYFSVSDVIKRWPESKARHEIVLISDGIDPLQPGPSDSYLDQTIEAAQRTGIQIYAIYAAHAGHFGHTLWRINQGQSNLSRLTDESGGEAYFEGLDTPIAFAPFLNEIAERINHQYRLTFLAIPDKKSSLQHIKLQTEVPDVELIMANKVYVPAEK